MFLYQEAEQIVDAWREKHYSHVLLNQRGAEFVLEEPGDIEILNATMGLLKPIAVAPNGSFTLYEVTAR